MCDALYAANYILTIVYCILPAFYDLLSTVYYLRETKYYVQYRVYYLLYTTYYILYPVYYILHAIYCMILHDMCDMICTMLYVLRAMCYVLYTIHDALHTIYLDTLHFVLCALYDLLHQLSLYLKLGSYPTNCTLFMVYGLRSTMFIITYYIRPQHVTLYFACLCASSPRTRLSCARSSRRAPTGSSSHSSCALRRLFAPVLHV